MSTMWKDNIRRAFCSVLDCEGVGGVFVQLVGERPFVVSNAAR